jgi:hypothetical protein
MLERCLGIALCLMLASPVLATDVPPSDESIQALLDLIDAHQLIEGMKTQVDATIGNVMQQSLEQALKGKTPTARQQAIIAAMKVKMTAMADAAVSWENLKPLYFRLYRQSFTQDDIDGITAFYRTPPGQSYLRKMPVLLHNMLGEYQGMLQPMQQQFLELARETVRQLQEPDRTPANNSG